MTAVLAARDLSVGYGHASVVRGLNLSVNSGEFVALLGANGSGKTTTLLALAGVLKPMQGEVLWQGTCTRAPLHTRARRGLAFVTEERSVFTRLTTKQNLQLGRRVNLEEALDLFPELRRLQHRRGGLLSGGEQQMVSLARALARPTKLLLADELSLGLAPKTVERLLQSVRAYVDRGMGALVVEQHVYRALEYADRVCVMRRGKVEFTGTAANARSHISEIEDYYLAGAR